MLLTLPPEIIHRVVRLSLDHASSSLDLSSEEYSNLRNLSLVHSRMRPWAQAELYRYIRLCGKREIKRVQCALEKTGTRLSKHIRQLFFQRRDTQIVVAQGNSVAIFIDGLVLRTLWLHNVEVDLAVLAKLSCKYNRYETVLLGEDTDLLLAAVLRELHLSRVIIAASTATLSFPRLTGLSLVNTVGTSSAWETFLDPSTLPKISVLSIARDDSNGNEPSALRSFLTKDLARILANIISLSVRVVDVFRDTAIFWNNCTRLEHLTVRLGHKEVDSSVWLVQALPQPLNLLRIVHGAADYERSEVYTPCIGHVEAAVTSGSGTAPKRLSLPFAQARTNCTCLGCIDTALEVNERLEELEKLALKAGVTVERHNLPAEDMFSHWETYLDEIWYVGFRFTAPSS